MLELSTKEIRDEIALLMTASAEETRTGSSQTAVSMLIEAQCLVAELIEDELNSLQALRALVPADDRD